MLPAASAGLHLRIGSSNLGGPERGLAELGHGFAALGRRLALAILDDGRTDWERLRALFGPTPVSLHRVAMAFRFDPLAIPRLARLARRLAAPLLHAHDYKSDVIAALAAPLCGRPWFTTFHGVYEGDGLPRLYPALDAWAARRARARFAIGPELVHVVRGAPAEVVANPIRVPAAAPRARIASPRRLLAAGRLAPQKGFDLLLEALAEVRDEVPALTLQLVGDGPERAALGAQAERLGLAAAVDFIGWVPEITELLDAADLVLVPSRWESQGRVLLEAMARGVPVLASATGTAPQLLADERCGRLIGGATSEAIAEALRWAAAREFDCAAIVERVRAVHAPEAVAARLVTSYRAAGVELPAP